MKVSFFLPSLNIGGIERVFITYANTLAENHEVDFVLCKREGKLLDEVSEQVNIVNLGNIPLSRSILRLRSYLKACKSDIVVTGGDFPNLVLIWASRLLKKRPRIIISQHNYFNIEVKQLGLLARFTPLLIKLFYHFADRIIAVSKGIETFLLKDLKQSRDKVVHIPNPIDLQEIEQKSLVESEFDLPNDYIVFIGRIGTVKNLKLLLDAFDVAELGNCKLLIVGSGSEEEELKNYSLGLKKSKDIYFTGATNNPLPIIRRSRVLVLPSFSEAFPTILLEAIALNTQIVATPTKGALEILDGIEGTYISNSFTDVEEFSQLLVKAWCNSEVNLSNYALVYNKTTITDSLLKSCLLH